MSEADDTTLYCAGLPLAETRALAADERALLSSLYAARRRRAYGWIGALLAGWLLVGALLSLVPPFPLQDVVAPVVIVAVIVATPVFIVLARDDFRLARALRKGLAAGRVQRFVGVLNMATLYDSTAVDLLARRLLRDDPDGQQCIETLEDANLVWTVNNERPRRWMASETALVTNAPEFAATAAEWVQPVTDTEGVTTWWNRRALSSTELSELRTHIGRAHRAVVVFLLINGYLIVHVVLRAQRREWVWLALYLAVLVWLGRRFLTIVRNVVRLRKDLALGAVAIVRTEAEEEASPGEPGLSPATEFLPFSHLIWSHGGEAAPWRRSRRR